MSTEMFKWIKAVWTDKFRKKGGQDLMWSHFFKLDFILGVWSQLPIFVCNYSVVKDCSDEQGHWVWTYSLWFARASILYSQKSAGTPWYFLTFWHFDPALAVTAAVTPLGMLFTRVCVSVGIVLIHPKEQSQGQALMLDEKAWLAISTLIPAKGVKWGWGQGSVHANPVPLHQTHLAITLHHSIYAWNPGLLKFFQPNEGQRPSSVTLCKLPMNKNREEKSL